MIALSLAYAIALANGPTAPAPSPVGRIYTSASLHVGIRMAALATPDELAIGVTVQLSANVL